MLPRILTPRVWWLRDILFLAILIAVIMGAWWALAYAGASYRPVQYITRIIVLIGINISLAVSLNIINGHAGQFSLGHVGFMAIGAYTAAYMTYYHFGPYVDSLPAARSPLSSATSSACRRCVCAATTWPSSRSASARSSACSSSTSK